MSVGTALLGLGGLGAALHIAGSILIVFGQVRRGAVVGCGGASAASPPPLQFLHARWASIFLVHVIHLLSTFCTVSKLCVSVPSVPYQGCACLLPAQASVKVAHAIVDSTGAPSTWVVPRGHPHPPLW